MRRTAAIDTARLRLRPYRETDLDALHRLWTAAEVRRYLWDGTIIERSVAAQAMQASIDGTAANGVGHWAVCLAGADALIGFCGFRLLDDSLDVELLYGLAPEYWQRGLATEASRAMLRYGFEEIGFARVYAITDVPNMASVAVMQRLGMQFDRRFVLHGRDGVRYVLTREAFCPTTEPYVVHYVADV